MKLSTLQRFHLFGAIAVSLALPVASGWAADAETNSTRGSMLLIDSLGRLVRVPTNEVPSGLLPPSGVNLNHQIPQPTRGALMPEALLQRTRESQVGFQFFPPVAPVLMPYLANQDEYGNTAVRPGPLFQVAPFEPVEQAGKYWLSEEGFRYVLEHTFTFVSMTDVKKGANNLDFYSLNFKSKWAIYTAPDDGMAGWISSIIKANSGFGSDTENQSPKSNLGTLTQPAAIWSSVNGVRVPELAWQQSLCGGEVVAVAGMVSQGNYLDRNVYAQSGGDQLFNSALVHSMVLPLPAFKFGLNLQWQPLPEWYGMMGGSVGDNTAGFSPWTQLNADYWSLLWEFGFAPRDVFGLGPGIYRAQPFVARSGEFTGGGLGFDLQQKLGPRSPFGWFGRFGLGDSEVTGAAAAQVGTGFAVQGPFKHVLLDRTSNDLLEVGFVWSQPSASPRRVAHPNEYVLETKYGVQLTPTIKLQPDFQMIWDPAYNSKADHAAVIQLQLYMAW